MINNPSIQEEKVLFSCSTVWPFKFFPTYLELTSTKLTIKRMILPFTYRTTPVFIKDLAIVRVSENPFFGNVSFEMMAMADEPSAVNFLRPADARQLGKLMIDLIEKNKTAQVQRQQPISRI